MERLDMKAVEALQLCTTRGGLQCGFKGKAKRVLPTTKEENVKNVMDFCRYDLNIYSLLSHIGPLNSSQRSPHSYATNPRYLTWGGERVKIRTLAD